MRAIVKYISLRFSPLLPLFLAPYAFKAGFYVPDIGQLMVRWQNSSASLATQIRRFCRKSSRFSCPMGNCLAFCLASEKTGFLPKTRVPPWDCLKIEDRRMSSHKNFLVFRENAIGFEVLNPILRHYWSISKNRWWMIWALIKFDFRRFRSIFGRIEHVTFNPISRFYSRSNGSSTAKRRIYCKFAIFYFS